VVALCYLVFYNVEITFVIGALRNSQWELFLLAFLVLVGERLVRPYRLAKLLGETAPVRQIVAAQCVSQVINLALPMRSGEIFLVFLLRATTRIPASYAFSVVVIDRLLDVVAILAIFAVAIAMSPGILPVANQGAILLGLLCVAAILGIVAVIAARERILAWTERGLQRFAPTRIEVWSRRADQVMHGFAILKDFRRVAIALAATAATWGLAVFAAWLVLRGIWPEAPIWAAALGICFGLIGTTLVSVPAGIGVLHAGLALGVLAFGTTQEVALAFAVVEHLLATGATLAMGIWGIPLVNRAGVSLRGYLSRG
jgi:uncharacterized protein (TIRG00374 family)